MWGRKRVRKPEQCTTFIDDGSTIEGCCRFTGSTVVAGRITGEQIGADHLIVGETGTVTGVIRATVVTVAGTICGTIVASERVELLATARITGDIETPRITIDAGAILDGRCHTVRALSAESPVALMPQTADANGG